MFKSIRRWWYRGDAIAVAPELWAEVEAPMAFLNHLPHADRMRLRELAREFIAEKEWSGAKGVELHAAMQLSIAVQACLLVLNLGLDWYRGWVGIVVYAGDFVVPRHVMDENGIVREFDDEVLGEAWEGGPVLLSWSDHAQPGINIVIHEFAHKLDMLNGATDGMPPLHMGMSRDRWSEAFTAAYEDHCQRVDRGAETSLDPYGSEHPAEFFAVASETFFEAPRTLRRGYPDVYEQLRLFYRQDPCAAC